MQRKTINLQKTKSENDNYKSAKINSNNNLSIAKYPSIGIGPGNENNWGK